MVPWSQVTYCLGLVGIFKFYSTVIYPQVTCLVRKSFSMNRRFDVKINYTWGVVQESMFDCRGVCNWREKEVGDHPRTLLNDGVAPEFNMEPISYLQHPRVENHSGVSMQFRRSARSSFTLFFCGSFMSRLPSMTGNGLPYHQ